MTGQEGRPEDSSYHDNELDPHMQNLIREALKSLGRDPDTYLSYINARVAEDPSLKRELDDMLFESFEDAVAKVMLSPDTPA